MNTNNRVGLPAQTLRTALYTRGNQLCLQAGKRPEAADAVLVGRHQGQWKPVGLTELQACFEQGSPSLEIGLWRDARRWAVLPPDGQVQAGEVQTLGERWGQSQLAESQTLDMRGQRDSQYALHFARVDVDQARIEGQQLVEPRTCSRSEVHTATGWDYSRRVGYYATSWKTESWGK